VVNVFIIDDHPTIIEGLAFSISVREDQYCLVGSSLTIKDALLKLSTLTVHVIILDLYLGNDSPECNLQLLRTVYPKVPVLIYSAEESTLWKYRMFRAGANAYLSKCSQNDTIISTIHEILDGSVLLTDDVKDILEPQPDHGKSDTFTTEEVEISNNLAFGLTLKEIATKSGKSLSSIEKKFKTLRCKTNANSNADLIRILIQRKLIPISNYHDPYPHPGRLKAEAGCL